MEQQREPNLTNPHEPLRPTELTWAALLAQWLDFAKASVALPDTAAGRRWKDSVASIVTLQAVTFALMHLDDLPEDERALGLDRAEILIRRSAGEIETIWHGEALHETLLHLLHDARAASRRAAIGPAIEWVVPRIGDGRGPAPEFVMPGARAALEAVAAARPHLHLRLAPPGTILIAGEPVGHAVGPAARAVLRASADESDLAVVALQRLTEALQPARAERAPEARQLYRAVDASRRIAGDVVAPLDGDPHPGRPLLETVWDGEQFTPPAASDAAVWTQRQREAWPHNGLPVRFVDAASPTHATSILRRAVSMIA